MAQNNDATDVPLIDSHRTGLTEIKVGDRLEFGEDSDLGTADLQVLKIDGDLVHVRATDPDEHTGEAWTLGDIETATESNDLRITRDGEVVA